MLHPVTFRVLAFSACAWLAVGEAAALTLGGVRGAVLVGRPLELAVPVTLDTAEPENPCAEADLFYGDQRLPRAPSVRWEPAAGDRQGTLRIFSPQAVDEPVVTLVVRVGCGRSMTRRYVLLSELPPAREAPPVVAGVPLRPSASTGRPESSSAARPPAAAPATVTRRRREAPVPATGPAASVARQARAAAAPPPESRAAARRRAAALQRESALQREPVQSRLRLDLLDLAPERDPVLRLSPNLTLPGAVDANARESAAAMWRALRRTPDEVLQEGLRLQTLERDLQSLRSLTEQNRSALAGMRQQVERANSERSQVSVLGLALLAALAAMIGWLLWQWRRNRPAGRGTWFEGAPPPGASTAAVVPAGAVVPDESSTAPAPGRTAAAEPPADPAQARRAARTQAVKDNWSPRDSSEFQMSIGGATRMVTVQELIDAHDKADFFLALGQHEQAIGVLEAHVHDQAETSALAWLDLLQMYHSLGRRDDFDRLRGEFRQRFAAQVPEFDDFDRPTSSLENYGRALSRIVALWPSRRVLEVIEESIFRKPGAAGAEAFSLEAYRDLILLYHIAKDVAPPEDSKDMPLEYRPTDFPMTGLEPLNSLEDATRTGAASLAVPLAPQRPDPDELFIPPPSPRVGVDIDLGEPGARTGARAKDEPRAGDEGGLAAGMADTSPVSGREPLDFDTSLIEPLDFDTSAIDAIGNEPGRKPK